MSGFARVPRSNLRAVKVDAHKRIIPKGSPTKPHWWRVTVGKRWTGTKKIRRFFQSEKAANEFIAETIAASQKRGRLAFAMPQKLMVEAMELAQQLESRGATLTEAVTFYLRHTRTTGQRTLNELLPDYLRTKANPSYRQAQEISLRLFAKEFGNKPLTIISPSAIEEWLERKNWKPLNAGNHLRDISMLFNWARLKDFVAENPCNKIKRPKVPRTVPVIFTVDEAERLLRTAMENKELELLPINFEVRRVIGTVVAGSRQRRSFSRRVRFVFNPT